MARVIENAKVAGKNFERAEGGTYLCEFTGWEDYEESVWVDGAKTDVKEPALRAVFKAQKGLTATDSTAGTDNEVKVSPTNSDGEPYEFRKARIRALPYGNDKATITKVVDQLAGRGTKKAPAITPAERPYGIDIDGFIGNLYRVTVLKVEDEKEPGKFYNPIQSIDVFPGKPPVLDAVLIKKAAPKASGKAAPVGEESDPFEN